MNFTVWTQIEVNENASIRLNMSNVEALVGSATVYFLANGDDFSGNAPQLKEFDSGFLQNVTSDVLLFNQLAFDFDVTEMKMITGLRFVGDNYFEAEDQGKLIYFSCDKTTSGTLRCDDNDLYLDLKSQNLTHIHTEVTDGVALIVLSTVAPIDDFQNQALTQKTVVLGIRLEDRQEIFEPKIYPFYTKFGSIRNLDQQVTIILGGANTFSGKIDMHYLSLNLTSLKFPESVGSLTSFHSHICPSQISWGPRGSNVVYVASICDNNGLDNHVFKYDINFAQPFKSTISEVYVIKGSRDFKICAQDRLVNVVDLEQDLFYAYDSLSSTRAKFYFPVRDYGIESIETYTCDQNNNILQLVGCRN